MFHDKELKAWRENKDALHAELDAAGVPKFEDEECRIAARVKWLMANKCIESAMMGRLVQLCRVHGITLETPSFATMIGWLDCQLTSLRENETVWQQCWKASDAVKKHHAQKADDRCWMDDNAIYEAFGLPPVDRSIGDPTAMLENCKRYIKNRCEMGGPWKSYAELEQDVERLNRMLREHGYGQGQIDTYVAQCEEIDKLKEENETLRRMQFAPSGDNHHNALACPYCSSDDQVLKEAKRRGLVTAPQNPDHRPGGADGF